MHRAAWCADRERYGVPFVSTVFTVNLHGASNSLHTCMTIVTSVFGRGRLGSDGAGGFCRDCALDKRPAGGDGSGATIKGCLRRRGVAPLADAERRAIFMARGPGLAQQLSGTCCRSRPADAGGWRWPTN
jgi:hypothetical protein